MNGSLLQWAANCGLRVLSRLLDEGRGEIDGWETAELAAVHDTLAALIAQVLGIDADDAFRALALLCDDDEAPRLTRGQPGPESAPMRLLGSRVLWITVSYESGAGGSSRRIAEVTYQDAAGELCSARSALDFGYDDLPARVRQRMMASGKRGVRYQLYPAPDPGRGGEGN